MCIYIYIIFWLECSHSFRCSFYKLQQQWRRISSTNLCGHPGTRKHKGNKVGSSPWISTLRNGFGHVSLKMARILCGFFSPSCLPLKIIPCQIHATPNPQIHANLRQLFTNCFSGCSIYVCNHFETLFLFVAFVSEVTYLHCAHETKNKKWTRFRTSMPPPRLASKQVWSLLVHILSIFLSQESQIEPWKASQYMGRQHPSPNVKTFANSSRKFG